MSNGCLEGIPGSGKTTLGMLLMALGLIMFRAEPVDAWRRGGTQSPLATFYADPRRWGLTFQIQTLISRARLWQAGAPEDAAGRPVFYERSVWSDRHIFAENGLREGLWTPWEHEVYCGVWDTVAAPLPEPAGYIYLRTPAQLCHDRIQRRGRREERDIPLDYLLRLETLHEEWLGTLPNVAVLDGTRYPTQSAIMAALERVGAYRTQPVE